MHPVLGLSASNKKALMTVITNAHF